MFLLHQTHADDSVLSRIPDPFGGPRMRGSGSYHGRNGESICFAYELRCILFITVGLSNVGF